MRARGAGAAGTCTTCTARATARPSTAASTVTGDVNIPDVPAATTPISMVRPRRRTLRLRSSGGWTLIELLTVISIIVLLAGMALAGYRNSIIRAQEAALKENLFRMRDAIDQYYADK